MLKLFVFLGNPGREYARTRHNTAWMAAERLSFSSGLVWQKKFRGEVSVRRGDAGSVYLLKPETFMNLSGESVQAALKFYRLAPGELMVVHDDLELPFGTVGVRKGGGLSGHNGLRSIAQSLGSPDFYRFRIGISRPVRGDVSSHVLGRFSPEEEPRLDELFRSAGRLLESCMTEDFEQTVAENAKTALL